MVSISVTHTNCTSFKIFHLYALKMIYLKLQSKHREPSIAIPRSPSIWWRYMQSSTLELLLVVLFFHLYYVERCNWCNSNWNHMRSTIWALDNIFTNTTFFIEKNRLESFFYRWSRRADLLFSVGHDSTVHALNITIFFRSSSFFFRGRLSGYFQW